MEAQAWTALAAVLRAGSNGTNVEQEREPSPQNFALFLAPWVNRKLCPFWFSVIPTSLPAAPHDAFLRFSNLLFSNKLMFVFEGVSMTWP